MNTVLGLSAYLVIMASLTSWTARNHRRLGPVLMRPLFFERMALGTSANHMVVMGITIFALSAGALLVGKSPLNANAAGAIEVAAMKLGAFCFVLNSMHFLRCCNLIRVYERGHELQRLKREYEATANI